jgi:hypothetical protein
LLFWLLLLPLLQLLFTLFISVVPINYLLEICCCLWVANVWPFSLLLFCCLFLFCYFYYCYSCLSTPKYTAISIKVVHEQSGKVEYERERLGIANKLMKFQSGSQQPFTLVFDFSRFARGQP